MFIQGSLKHSQSGDLNQKLVGVSGGQTCSIFLVGGSREQQFRYCECTLFLADARVWCCNLLDLLLANQGKERWRSQLLNFFINSERSSWWHATTGHQRTGRSDWHEWWVMSDEWWVMSQPHRSAWLKLCRTNKLTSSDKDVGEKPATIMFSFFCSGPRRYWISKRRELQECISHQVSCGKTLMYYSIIYQSPQLWWRVITTYLSAFCFCLSSFCFLQKGLVRGSWYFLWWFSWLRSNTDSSETCQREEQFHIFKNFAKLILLRSQNLCVVLRLWPHQQPNRGSVKKLTIWIRFS